MTHDLPRYRWNLRMMRILLKSTLLEIQIIFEDLEGFRAEARDNYRRNHPQSAEWTDVQVDAAAWREIQEAECRSLG
jgi:hypothetical protein